MTDETSRPATPLTTINDVIVSVGKGISIKREKGPDDGQYNVAHLKFSDVFMQRGQVDQLLRRVVGWCDSAFFDANGDPVNHLEIGVPLLRVTVTGTIRGPDDACLRLMQAELKGVTLALCRHGALMSGELAWIAAGDEVSDVDSLLGQDCMAYWDVHDGAQMTIFDSERGKPE